MALNGDDEIELLLSQMGGGGAAAAPAHAETTSEKVTSEKKKKKSINKDERSSHKRKKKKRKRDHSKDDVVAKDSSTIFAESRLTQNPHDWPCCSNGIRLLELGSGLMHDCNGYSSSAEKKETNKYGSNLCKSCCKSAATHELCISSSKTNKDNDHHDDHPFSATSIASIITSARNARCILGEYYKETESQKQKVTPPVNATRVSAKLIMSKLDLYVGRILSRVKKMENNRTRSALISSSDIDLLREKVSTLVKATFTYKEAIKPTASGVALVEARLAAMAACDDVYYRSYYACFFLVGQIDLTPLVPHPATYFTCPGLAWDASDSGMTAFDVFMGDAELDDATKELLLDSWCLNERLTSSKARQANPLLSLWQSRFLENIRHIWTTKYTHVKSPLALKAELNMKHLDDNNADPLIRHETYALSPEAETWRGSIRDYPANFYAYASPTPKVLDAILEASLHERGSVVEAGAGTGYLSAIIASQTKRDTSGEERLPSSVFPYDITPPRQSIEAASNEYHGQVPTFIDVNQAHSFEQASQSILAECGTNTCLLLCYPPPASEMASIALSQYIATGGETVLHIGEWKGLTGSQLFESMLCENFSCKENDAIPLPIWGTDATYLSIWRKNQTDAASEHAKSISAGIGFCSVIKCPNQARRRCRFARCVQYCSQECFEADFRPRRAIFALHMIHLTACNELNFENDNHFMPLLDFESGQLAHVDQSQKKRKKKKNHNKR